VKINESDSFKISVLRKVLERSHVLITSQLTVEQITSHYHKYRWHQSTGSRFQSVGNFPMRYGLNKTVRNKLQSM
jgi:IS4 transposase